MIQGSRNAKPMEEGERKTGVLAQQDLGHQGSVSRGRLMKTRNTEGLRWERRRCYRSKNKQQTSNVHSCPKVSSWVSAAFRAPQEQQGLGSSPGTAGNLGPGHPGGSHLRLEAILNTSALLCAFVPPSPSSSCSTLSMLSRSCSCCSSSLHSKGQELPWGGCTPHPGSPAGMGQHKHQPWGYFLSSGLEFPAGRAMGGSKANTCGLLLAPKPAEEPGKRSLHFPGR